MASFGALMIGALVLLLGYVLSGAAHRSAHPNGEPPAFKLSIGRRIPDPRAYSVIFAWGPLEDCDGSIPWRHYVELGWWWEWSRRDELLPSVWFWHAW